MEIRQQVDFLITRKQILILKIKMIYQLGINKIKYFNFRNSMNRKYKLELVPIIKDKKYKI